MQVDEDAAAQQPVDVVLAGRVAAHQALDRGGLVGAVVVDVEAGVLLPARHDGVDEALEHALLPRRLERPRRVVVAAAVRDAEQVLEPAVGREEVAFEVEEHVAVRRLGQRRKSLVGLDRRDELVDETALPPSMVPHPRLLADADQRGRADPVEPGRDRQPQRAQRPHRRHIPFGQSAPLAPGDAGDQREVVVGPAPRRAGLLPLANAAVLDRLRVRVRRRGRVRLEALPNRAVVRRVLRHPEARLILAAGPAEREMHQLGFDHLRQRQQVRVQKKLQQRLSLRPAGQLRIEDLVGPSAQRTRPVCPEQEVGIAAPPPASVLKTPLVDHVGPALHRVPSPGGDRDGVPVRERRVGRDDCLDGAPVCRQLLQEALLVLEAPLPQDLGAWVVVRRRRLQLPECDATAQAREVVAGKVAAEVRCRERELAVGMAHGGGTIAWAGGRGREAPAGDRAASRSSLKPNTVGAVPRGDPTSTRTLTAVAAGVRRRGRRVMISAAFTGLRMAGGLDRVNGWRALDALAPPDGALADATCLTSADP